MRDCDVCGKSVRHIWLSIIETSPPSIYDVNECNSCGHIQTEDVPQENWPEKIHQEETGFLDELQESIWAYDVIHGIGAWENKYLR